MRLGLHASTAGAGLPIAQLRARSNVFGAVIKLDAYASLILGLPSFIRIQDLDPIILNTLSTVDPQSQSTLRNKASAMHFELLRLTMLSREQIFSNSQSDEEVELTALANVEKRLQDWTKEVSPFLADEDENDSVLIRHELEMSYHFVQMLLFRPFLHYLSIMAEGKPLSFNESQHALACIKVASTTIARSEAMMSKGLWPPASWTSFYALFLSTMCLTFLIACHSGTSHPSEAWKKAALGINVLAAYRCTDTCASSALDVLRLVVSHLSHTVQFDLQQIEATPNLCGRRREANSMGGTDIASPGAAKLSLAHILINPTPIRRSSELASPEWQSNADKILAQAEEMSLMYGFDMLDDFQY